MINKIHLFLFVSLCNISSVIYAQTYLKDSQSKVPVTNAHFLNRDGQLIGISDMDGKVCLFPEYAHCTDSVEVAHISYQSVYLSRKELQTQKTIWLLQQINQLPEVAVTATRKYDYIVIKGYYRSYQLNEQTPVYYSDGIIKYFVPKNQKGAIRYYLLFNRTFRNNSYLNQEKNRSVTVTMKTAGVMNYADYWIPYKSSDYTWQRAAYQLDTIAIQNKKHIQSGKAIIDRKNKRTMITVDCLYPMQEKRYSLFNYTSVIKTNLYSQQLGTSDIRNATIANLNACKRIRQIDFKHKKDTEFVRIDGVDEFYVLEVSTANKSDIREKTLSDEYDLIPTKNKNDFSWLDNPSYHIPPLGEFIRKKLCAELEIF